MTAKVTYMWPSIIFQNIYFYVSNCSDYKKNYAKVQNMAFHKDPKLTILWLTVC